MTGYWEPQTDALTVRTELSSTTLDTPGLATTLTVAGAVNTDLPGGRGSGLKRTLRDLW
jgi:hypothetical protein